MHYNTLDTPIGPLLLAGTGERQRETLRIIGFPKGKMRINPEAGWREDDTAFAEAREQLTEYFAGQRDSFKLDLTPAGTDFQKRVWGALEQIPYGSTVSYRELAESIGSPSATRAVGAANGKKPLPIVLPCHRVVGADGSLTGFGGGLETKRFLLELEGAVVTKQKSLEL